MTFSRFLSEESKVDRLCSAASSDMSNWKSCSVGALGRFQTKIDLTDAMNDWAGGDWDGSEEPV
jgi:hypothetical protein